MTDEILTATGEDNEIELLQWKLDRTAEEAARQSALAKEAWERVRGLQQENATLEERLDRLTSRMTVAELRRVGVGVALNFDFCEED